MDNCAVRMSSSLYVYGYEYLGASARLVITPLTVSILQLIQDTLERCYSEDEREKKKQEK